MLDHINLFSCQMHKSNVKVCDNFLIIGAYEQRSGISLYLFARLEKPAVLGQRTHWITLIPSIKGLCYQSKGFISPVGWKNIHSLNTGYIFGSGQEKALWFQIPSHLQRGKNLVLELCYFTFVVGCAFAANTRLAEIFKFDMMAS